MGVPFKKIAEIGLGVAGMTGVLPNSDKERLKQEAEENQILMEILKAQQLTNVILLRFLAEDIGEEEFDEFVKSLG